MNKKIGLDIDGVICDFQSGMDEVAISLGIEPIWDAWSPRWFNQVWTLIKNDYDWWLNLPVLDRPHFNVEEYITGRSIPIEVTKEWLKRNGFPGAPVLMMEEKIVEHLDIFIDDKPEIFLSSTKVVLYDHVYNQHIDTKRRIKKLKEVDQILF